MASLGQGLTALGGSSGVLVCGQGWGRPWARPDRAGKATGALQTLTGLCLVGLLAVSELGTPKLDTASSSLPLIGTNGPFLHVFI